MRRILMGIIKGKNGVFYASKKVPARLVTAVGRSWLRRSLGTKDVKVANVLGKPVLIEFDRTLARAENALKVPPLREHLSAQEIERMAEYHHASRLAEDDELLRQAPEEEALRRNIAKQLQAQGLTFTNDPQRRDINSVYTSTPLALQDTLPPAYGLSERQWVRSARSLLDAHDGATAALANGNISCVSDEVGDLLDTFGINLDRKSPAYYQLGMAVLRAEVEALDHLMGRRQGVPIETPRVAEPGTPDVVSDAGTLREAFDGWKTAKSPSESTLKEFDRAIRLFEELHGATTITSITRAHVRQYREALQRLPKRCETFAQGNEAGARGKQDSKGVISAKTINKLMSGPQAVAEWAFKNGYLPEDAPWSNPFNGMTLEEKAPTREPWDIAELRLLFASPVYTRQQRPKAGCGEAAYWLPLLGIYTGARLGELASLARSDVITDEETGIVYLRIAEDEARGRRVKTASSLRVVPVHPELVRLGFLSKVVEQEAGQLFPLIKPGFKDGYGEAWSKWFGRYIRSIGITNKASVFHSFRHGFKDALRAAAVSEDVNDALTGHAGAGGVGRKYGAKEMMRRFGLKRLAEAVALVEYPGLDLRHLG